MGGQEVLLTSKLTLIYEQCSVYEAECYTEAMQTGKSIDHCSCSSTKENA